MHTRGSKLHMIEPADTPVSPYTTCITHHITPAIPCLANIGADAHVHVEEDNRHNGMHTHRQPRTGAHKQATPPQHLILGSQLGDALEDGVMLGRDPGRQGVDDGLEGGGGGEAPGRGGPVHGDLLGAGPSGQQAAAQEGDDRWHR